MERLGSGGFGVVDRVRSKLTLQEYARKRLDRTKTFARNREALALFENEVHNLKRLSHFHLIEFKGSYTDKRYVGIIMQPVADIDLRHYMIGLNGSVDELSLLRSFVGCLSTALMYLHKEHCRHKDLKPSNILIKGRTVLVADFGTVFDWSDSEDDITAGPPEAFTRMYIAPEVAEHASRNKSSDIWSLGCIFMEIATVLAGKSLQSKSDFFAQHEASTDTAYWRNHDAICAWLVQLGESPGFHDGILHQWVKRMTALNPKERPSAAQLVFEATRAQLDGSRYGQSCCFDNVCSDDSSWHGSISADEEDIFETAKTISDATTMSVGSEPASNLLLHEVSLKDVRQTANEESLIMRSPQPSSSKAVAVQNDSSSQTYGPPPVRSNTISPTTDNLSKDTARTRGIEEARRVESRLPGRARVASSATIAKIENDAVLLPVAMAPSDASSEAQDNLGALANSPPDQDDIPANLTALFWEGHQYLENYMVHLRREDSDWLAHVRRFLSQELVDAKGFNMLHISCKFHNSALSRDVVPLVLEENPGLLEVRTIYKNTAIHYLALKGRTDLLRLLISKGASTNLQNIRLQTPLHIALHRGQSEVAKAIIEHTLAMDINLQDDRGWAPIHFAARNAEADVVLLLIAAGAQVSLMTTTEVNVIHLARSSKRAGVLRALSTQLQREGLLESIDTDVKSQAQVNTAFAGMDISNCHCKTCLLRKAVRAAGVQYNNTAVAFELCCPCPNHMRLFAEDSLSAKWNENAKDDGCSCRACEAAREYNTRYAPCGTPIDGQYLAFNDSLEQQPSTPSLRKLPPKRALRESYGDKSRLYYPGHKALDLEIDEQLRADAPAMSFRDLTTKALEMIALAGFKGSHSYRKIPSTALSYFVQYYYHYSPFDGCYHRIVEILIDAGAYPNVMTSYSLSDDGRPPEPLCLLDRAASASNLTLIKLLVEKKVQLVPFRSRLSPLGRAVYVRSRLVPRMLLRAGADVDEIKTEKENFHKQTSLGIAVAANDMYLIALLLAHGARLNTQDARGNTPLHIAIMAGHASAVTILLENGADIESINKNGSSPLSMALGLGHDEIVTILLARGAFVYGRVPHAANALSFAISMGRERLSNILLQEYDSQKDVPPRVKGDTILHQLARSSISDTHVIELLFDYGIDVEIENVRGSVALHCAAESGNLSVAKKLLLEGAATRGQNHAGKTPLDYARRGRHREIVELLGGQMKKRR
ncbi:hypothetical protein ACN47E_001043 [Coniothyrium glycines]